MILYYFLKLWINLNQLLILDIIKVRSAIAHLNYQIKPPNIKRNTRGWFKRSLWSEFRFQTRHITGNVIAGAVLAGILMGLFVQISLDSATVVQAKSEEVIEEPKEVRIEVVTDWTKERIEQEIRDTFPESPELALAIFKCESGLNPTAKGPTSDFGIAQIHEPSWGKKAKQLGLENYKTDVKENLAMARYIYEGRGNFNDWVCYTKKMI